MISSQDIIDIKVYNRLTKIVGGGVGDVHILSCPITNKELATELLCGLDPNYSTNRLVIYSGWLEPVPNIKLFITCIDIIIDNMIENINTNYLWHGKCFTSFPSSTEVFLNHSLSFDKNVAFTGFTIRDENKTILYSVKSPPLDHKAYTFYKVPLNQNFSTQHIHRHRNFFPTGPEPFCESNQSTSFMNINFANMDGAYYLKLRDLRGFFFHKDLHKLFGLKSTLGAADLVQSQCTVGWWTDIKSMDTWRAVVVEKNTTVPVTANDISLSKAGLFPSPYTNLTEYTLHQLYMSKCQKIYNVNDKLMDFVGYEKY